MDNLKRVPADLKRSVDAIRAQLEREPLTDVVTSVAETQICEYVQYIGPTSEVDHHVERYFARWDEILYGTQVLRHVTMGPHTVALVSRRLNEW